ncbi:MAG: AtpZ/AtpI family protein [Desulfobacterales bacterium]|nr:AtpZ/AtpI family protein [Desulfobacterales bacterium]
MKDDTKKFLREIAYFSSIGFSVSLSIFIGLFFGLYLDRSVFGTTPWCTLLFLGFGIAAAYRNILLAIKKSKNL